MDRSMKLFAAVVGMAVAFGPAVRTAAAQGGPGLEHKDVTCVEKGSYPIFKADVTGDVRAVRVYFHSNVDPIFYYVTMEKVAGTWQAPLPSPLAPPTESITYYIEALDSAAEFTQTAQIVASVEDSCDNDKAAAGTRPDITVVATQAGAPQIPAGFAAGGIVALALSGGGAAGLSTAAALGLLGGAAGLTAVIVATTGGDEVSPR